MNFCSRLRNLREKTSLNQKEFAKAIKMSYTTYNGYEIGKREPDIDTIKFFADYFNVTVDYLVGRTNDPDTKILTDLPDEWIKSGIDHYFYSHISCSGELLNHPSFSLPCFNIF